MKSPAKPAQVVRAVLALAPFAILALSLLISCGKKERPAKARPQQPQIANRKSEIAKPSPPRRKPPPPRSWTLPAAPANTPDKEDFYIVDLAVNHIGTVALLKSKREVHCFDVASGQIVRTWAAPKPAWDYMKPDTRSMILSANAQLISTELPASRDAKDKTVTIQNVEREGILALGKLDRDEEYSADAACFNAAGDMLFLPGVRRTNMTTRMVIHSLRVGQRTKQTIDLPFVKEGVFKKLFPVPGESVFLAYGPGLRAVRNVSGFSVIDLASSSERSIQSLKISPFCLGYECGAALSPDGKWLLAKSPDKIEICDWRTDTRVFERTQADINYRQARFTPDSQRFIVERVPLYFMMTIGGPNAGKRENVPCTLELYDIATQKRLADYELPVGAAVVALSGDGRTILYASGSTLYAIAFKAAFGVEPL